MASDYPDSSCYFGDQKLSDVELVLYEESAVINSTRSSHKRKRGPEQVLQCHAVVLGISSAYCRTKLESPSNWDTQPARGNSGARTAKHCIEMPVPAGQLETGQLLIKSMYETRPNYSSISQTQLLQLLLLADRYEASSVVAAACRTLEAVPVEQFQWDPVTAVYQLPAGCADLEACKGMFAAAAAKLQQELGDLELVWADDSGSKQQMLCGLPYVALKQLLQDPATRVASENTTFYTIERWYGEQKRSARPSVQLMNELVQLVRVRHCSQLFVATHMCESSLAQQCFTTYERSIACIISGSSTSAATHNETLQEASCPALAAYPAWRAEKRPASAMKQLILDWKLPLIEVKEMFKELLQDFVYAPDRHSELHIWQGVAMQLLLELDLPNKDDSSGQKCIDLGLYLRVPVEATTVCRITSKLILVGAATGSRDSTTADIEKGPEQTPNGYSQEARCWGYGDMLALGAVSSWAEAEAVLRRKKLVHADGCLHLRGVVKRVQ